LDGSTSKIIGPVIRMKSGRYRKQAVKRLLKTGKKTGKFVKLSDNPETEDRKQRTEDKKQMTSGI